VSKYSKEGKEETKCAIAAAGSHPLDKGFLIPSPAAESTPPDQDIGPCRDAWANGISDACEHSKLTSVRILLSCSCLSDIYVCT
jgi:hypothetical protein